MAHSAGTSAGPQEAAIGHRAGRGRAGVESSDDLLLPCQTMRSVLVTGATGFVGYHLVRLLKERGAMVRALARRGSRAERLRALGVEVVEGDIEDPASLPPAFRGLDTVFHVAGLVGPYPPERLRRVNVEGVRNVLDAAERAGVLRTVVTSSVAAVGVNRRPEPLDETVDWAVHGLDYPYATTKREGEALALERAQTGLPVVVVNPSVVIGPEDTAPTPGGGVIGNLARGRVPGTLRAGLAYVDVRDVAAGHLLAAERGRSGERYILSAANVMMGDFFRAVAARAGARPPRFQVPYPVVYAAALASEAWAAVTGGVPGISRGLVRIAGRYSWFDSSKARTELGWAPRPLEETVGDTVEWFKDRRS